MGITRILWDDLIEGYIKRTSNKFSIDDDDLQSGILYILMALQDIDGRISDLEEQHSEIQENLKPKKSDNYHYIQ